MRKLVPVLVLSLLAFAASCSGDEERQEKERAVDLGGILKESGVLTVGAEPPAPPFIIPPYPANPTGFEVDVAEEIGRRLGLETKWIEFRLDEPVLTCAKAVRLRHQRDKDHR